MGLHTKEEPLWKKQLTWLREIAIVVVLALVATTLVRAFVLQVFYVPSASMEDTLQINDRLVVSKIPGSSKKIERGDVIVFNDDNGWMGESTEEASWLQKVGVFLGIMSDPSDQVLVKRVIGVGGDTVECEGNGAPIYVNGVAIDETYLPAGTNPSNTAFSVTVPEGYYWVMGDNRSNSADSRYHLSEGTEFVSADSVIGRVTAIIWPISHWATVGHREVFADIPDPE